jgi:hypothetical protein
VYTNASGTNVYMLSKNSSVTCFGSNTTVKNNGGTIVATNLSPENIKKDVEILGVVGTFEGGATVERGSFCVKGDSTTVYIDVNKAKAFKFHRFDINSGDETFCGLVRFTVGDSDGAYYTFELETEGSDALGCDKINANTKILFVDDVVVYCANGIGRQRDISDFDFGSLGVEIQATYELGNNSSSEIYIEYEVIY